MRAPKLSHNTRQESDWSYFCLERAHWPGEGQGMSRDTEPSKDKSFRGKAQILRNQRPISLSQVVEGSGSGKL